MPNDIIRYDLRCQEALRGVVRDVLAEVAKDGLPGTHHFLLSFRTDAAGVRVSNALREKYPEEMTIVLQHHFWDLKVGEHQFEVGLSFSNIPEKLVVPFNAVIGFRDPAVGFELQFDPDSAGSETSAEATPIEEPKPDARRQAMRGRASEPKEAAPKVSPQTKQPAASDTAAAAKQTATEAEKIVSLDAFRRKT
jgi:hypothetical protein